MPLSKLLRDVGDFQKKFGMDKHESDRPGFMEMDLALFRFNFLQEELNEAAHAHGLVMGEDGIWKQPHETVPDWEPSYKGLAECLDGHIDLLYILVGNLRLMGFHATMPPCGFDRASMAWHKVQVANMSKERALAPEQSKRFSTYDIVKPAGWTPPDHGDLVK